MAVVYTKNDQGLTITVGNGVPIHSANNGDRYTDLDTGKLYVYQSAWVVAGSEVGVFGISDSAGIYTYYTTLTLAMAAASSGDTIEMFADVEETGDVTVTHKNGVNINGNGHTYTLSADTTADNLRNNDSSFYAEIYNLKIVRSGRAAGTSTGFGLNYGTTYYLDTILVCSGVNVVNTFGDAVRGKGTYRGVHAKGYLSGISTAGTTGVYNCYGESTSSGDGIYVGAGSVYNSVGVSVSGAGVYGTKVYNSSGFSTSGTGVIGTQGAFNVQASSTSGYGMSNSICYNCYSISSSNYAFYLCSVYNSRGVSATSRAYSQGGLTYTISNNTFESSGTYTVAIAGSSVFSNNTVVCLWNNAGGHALYAVGDATITHNSLRVTSISANCIGGGAYNVQMALNSFKGSTTPVNPSITQLITNTSDSQGNILI